MKNTILNFRVAAVVLGLTLALAGSAFKPAVVGDLHAKVNGQWVDIPDSYQSGIDYDCVSDGMCTARFELEGNEQPTDENFIPGSLQSGTYDGPSK